MSIFELRSIIFGETLRRKNIKSKWKYFKLRYAGYQTHLKIFDSGFNKLNKYR